MQTIGRQMKTVFLTRFSFFGQSGWRSEASRDPGQLFDPERLKSRLDLFERITLASLRSQTDPDFDLVVLSSDQMPRPFRKRLKMLCGDILGDRAKVLFKPYGSAGHNFRGHVRRAYRDHDLVTQVVLDDDDAVSADYVAACRFHATHLAENPHSEDPVTFLSFARGYTVGIEDGAPAWLAPRNVPFTNLGLAMIAAPNFKKNPFMTSHRRIGDRYPSHVVGSNRPYYLRAVHGHNDSRAISQDARLSPEEIADSFRYFPLLADYFPAQLPMAAE